MARFRNQQRRLLLIDAALRKAREQALRESAGQMELGFPETRFPNCQSLARDLEVSAKTVQRDIDYLRDQEGAPIAYDYRRKGYWYTEPHFNLPAIQLTESDLFAIFIAERALEQYENTPLHGKLCSVFEKIQRALPEKVSVHPSWAGDRISFFQPPPRRVVSRVWDTAARALNLGRRLLIGYQTPAKGRRPPRRVDPYHMINYRGEWYLLGYCHRHDEIRNFALSRITYIEMLSSRFRMPEHFDPARMFAQAFGIIWGEETHDVRLRFTPKAAPFVRERTWHKGQEIKDLPDGSLEFRVTASHLWELAAWVRSWGAQVKVLAPPALVREVAEDLAAAAAQYRPARGPRRPRAGRADAVAEG